MSFSIKFLNIKFFLFVFFFLFGFLFFISNFYKEYPSVIVLNDKVVSKNDFDETFLYLKNSNFEFKNIIHDSDKVIYVFFTYEEQVLFKNFLENYFKNKHFKLFFKLDIFLDVPFYLNYFYFKPVKLGLDLKGGVRFLMELDFDSVVTKNIENYYNNVRHILKKENLSYLSSDCKNSFFEFKFNSLENMNIVNSYLKNKFSELSIKVDNKKNLIHFYLDDSKIDDIKESIINQSLYSFRKRIDELGLSESNIRKYGDKNIIIELPGLQNIDKAKNILGKTITINFFMVEDNYIYNSVNKYIPLGSKLLYDRNANPILLKKKLILSGDFISSAYSSLNEEKKPCVNVKLTQSGAQNFLNATTENVGKLIAVVYSESFIDVSKEFKELKVKEEIINVARILQPLYDRFQITGLTLQESNDLSLILRSGALPTNISIIEEKIIGPSLGKDNINKGYNAVIGGLILILLFMVFYYGFFGLIANICLIFNLFLLIFFMSILDAVLTLPGIAGIVLILGMSIDANVLIFERIREKRLNNVNFVNNVIDGYKHSFITIIDSNLTTFFVGLLLFIIGDGPIKGFAITLCIGITTSLYSSIVCTRIIIDFFLKKNSKFFLYGF